MNHQPNTPASLNEAVALIADILAQDDKLCRALGLAKIESRSDSAHQDWKAMQKTWDNLMNRARSMIAAPGAAIDAREQTEIADRVVQMVGEMDDRTSPEDWPEAMLVTGPELHAFILLAFERAAESRQEAPVASAQGSPEFLLGWKRYEKARKLSPFQWNRLHIRNLAGENFDAMIDSLPEPTTPVPIPSEALSPATVAQPVAWWIPEAEQFCMNSPEGRPFDKHWEPLYAAAAAQPCASQGCGGAVSDDAIDAALGKQVWFDRKDVRRIIAALSTDKSGGA